MIVEIFLYMLIFLSVMVWIYIIYRWVSSIQDIWNRKISQDIDTLFMEIDPKQLWRWTIIGGVVVFVISLFILKNYLIGLIIASITFILPKIALEIAKRRRLRKFDDQLVQAIGMIASSLRAGVSFNRGLEIVTNEMPPPISQEFGLVLKANQLGTPLGEAMDKLRKRVPSDDLNIVVTAMRIAQETGGHLAEVFERIEKTIRERNRIVRKLDALTSMGRLQAIIGALLPFGIGILLMIMSPDIMKPFINNIQGKVAIGIAFGLEILGFYSIKKITTIEV